MGESDSKITASKLANVARKRMEIVSTLNRLDVIFRGSVLFQKLNDQQVRSDNGATQVPL